MNPNSDQFRKWTEILENCVTDDGNGNRRLDLEKLRAAKIPPKDFKYPRGKRPVQPSQK